MERAEQPTIVPSGRNRQLGLKDTPRRTRYDHPKTVIQPDPANEADCCPPWHQTGKTFRHSDMAPQREGDPGPRFPWRRLASEGRGIWPDASRVASLKTQFDTQLPDLAWFRQKLAQQGYEVPQTTELDEATRKVIAVFQMRYRPALFDGTPDAETAAILEVLTSPSGLVGDGAVN